MFCIKNIEKFDQWEARENFLRIVLIDPGGISDRDSIIALCRPMFKDKSAVVTAYAMECIYRLTLPKNKSTAKKILEKGQEGNNIRWYICMLNIHGKISAVSHNTYLQMHTRKVL